MNEHYEQEIDLKWLLYRMLRAWRIIVFPAILIAVLVGGVKLALNLNQISDTSRAETAQKSYEEALATWQATIDRIDAELANLEKSKEQQLIYNENSVLMQINPLRECNASFDLYVDYDYRILPELSYQNPNLSAHILKAYETYMTNGEMYRYILENFDSIQEIRYLTELFTVKTDTATNMISVSVKHSDAAACEQLLQLAKESLEQKQADIATAIDNHKLIVTTTASYETVNLALEETQKKNRNYITDLDTTIKAKNDERTAATEPTLSAELTRSWAVLNAIKYLLIAGVAFAFVVAVVIAGLCILSGKLLNPMDIKARFGLRTIALLPRKKVKRPFAFISRWVSAFGAITTAPEDYDKLSRMAGTSIKSDLASREEAKTWSTIAFTGTVSDSEIQKVLDSMDLKSTYTLICAPDILTNADSIDKVSTADCVVLVEAQELSLLNNISKELEALKAWNKPVLGAIITNTDAVM